jgi:sigma-B regulation protein RsbU (phosphoserine phosphatase)
MAERRSSDDDVEAIVRKVLGGDALQPPGGLGWMDAAEPESPGSASGWARPGARPRESETDQARHIQLMLLPQPLRLPGLATAVRFEPHHAVSGDFYDFFRLPEGRIGIVQGDVSGHGTPAGIVMAMAKQTIRILAAGGAAPGRVLTEADRWLHGAMAGKFVSATYLTIDTSTGEMRFARAGHTPLALVNAAGGTAEVLAPKGMALGLRDAAAFAAGLEETSRRLRPGDLLVLATDGILETADRHGAEFGIERLAQVALAHAPAGPEAVVNRILDAARHFGGSARLDDDAMALAAAFG